MKKFLPLLGICVLVAACAGAGTATPSPAPATPSASPTPSPTPAVSPGYVVATGPDKLILRIATAGGFIRPDAALTALPEFALFGDGRVIVPGPIPTISPAPLLPSVLVMQITPAEIQKVVAAADKAGLLGPDTSYGPVRPVGIADTGSADFTTVVDGKVHRITAAALSPSGDVGGGSDPAVDAARAKLAHFWSEVSNLPAFLGRTIEDTQAYVPAGMRVFLTDAGPADPAQPTGRSLAWPLADPAKTGQQTLVPGTVCVAVTGSDLASFLAAAGKAGSDTVWTFGTARYDAAVRPLYPNETGCAGGSL